MHRFLASAVITLLCAISGCALVPTSFTSVTSIDLDLPMIPDATVSRAVTWENPTGEPGAGGKARDGRKGAPCIRKLENGATATLMDVDGPGVIRHIWLTIPRRTPEVLRSMILRMYWDGSAVPCVEVPLSDFFGSAHGRTTPLTSYYTTMTLGRGFNCYFAMPFHKHAKITLQNDQPDNQPMDSVFFQIDYDKCDALPPNTGLFHAQFRRENPTVEKRDFVLLDNVEGPGMFIGCVIGVRALSEHWWGEGEMKFYMDGDTQYPTICGTGTEDYFNAAWGMDLYQNPYHGCTLNLKNEFYKFPLVSMYRWHVKDPVYFQKSFKAAMQQIGYNKGLYERSDDWCSTAFWYQMTPVKQMPPFPDREARTAGIVEPKKA